MLLHGDLHPQSVLVSPESQVQVIDHELCEIGRPAYDLGLVLAHGTLLKAAGGQVDLAAFLEGYEGQWGVLDPEEKQVMEEVSAFETLRRLIGAANAGYLTETSLIQSLLREAGDQLV